MQCRAHVILWGRQLTLSERGSAAEPGMLMNVWRDWSIQIFACRVAHTTSSALAFAFFFCLASFFALPASSAAQRSPQQDQRQGCPVHP